MQLERTENILCFYDTECADLEHVSDVMHRFIQKFRPKQSLTINWATWCSKPRPGEFGGGTIGINAFDIDWSR